MKITKELRALVITTLARMSDSDFRATLKAALDGRRAPEEKLKRKYTRKNKPGPKKKKAKKAQDNTPGN